jgi:hypothetical protein
VFLWILLTLSIAVISFAQEKPAAKSSNAKAGAPQKQAMIREALSAAPPEIAKTATVKDWDGNVLKEGSSAYTCYPTPPMMKKMGKEPMCLDKVWEAWGDAWKNHKDFTAQGVGIAYMLEGDTGASNTDPFATSKTSGSDWVVSGPHTMVVVPDKAALDAVSTDPNNGGPWVMWKGTPYAHVMVPVGKKPAGAAAQHVKQ